MSGMRRSLLLLLVLVVTSSWGVEEEPPRTMVDGDSATPKVSSSAGREQRTGPDEVYGEHIINPDRAGLREYFKRMDGVAPWVKDCDEWSSNDSRIGMLLPGAVSRLFIGKPKANGDGIDDVEKNYEVSSIGIGGSPFEGTVHVLIQAPEMRAEKACLEKLRGTAIRWGRSVGDSGYPDVAGEAVVRNVQFSRAVRMDSSGEVSATDAFVATLTVSEGVMSMVFREMSAHVWGLVGSALLMVLVAVGGWVVRRLRKAMEGADTKPRSLPFRRGLWRKTPLVAAIGRDSTAEEQAGEEAIAAISDVVTNGANTGKTDVTD